MTNEAKIIKTKVGVLELAKQLGNVSRACQIMGTAATASIGSESCTRPADLQPDRGHHRERCGLAYSPRCAGPQRSSGGVPGRTVSARGGTR